MPSTFIQLENKVTCSLHLQLQAALQTGFSILGDKPCEIAFFFKYIPQLQLFFCSYSDLLCACQLFYSFFLIIFESAESRPKSWKANNFKNGSKYYVTKKSTCRTERTPQTKCNSSVHSSLLEITALTPFVTLVWFTVIIPARVWQPESDRNWQ